VTTKETTKDQWGRKRALPQRIKESWLTKDGELIKAFLGLWGEEDGSLYKNILKTRVNALVIGGCLKDYR